jgi:hypothetical protein
MATVINFKASTGQLPETKPSTTLIVLCAFDRDDEGNLQPAFEPREMPDERRAMATARLLSLSHVGVITWRRQVNVAVGEYGPSEVLYRSGDVPDLD